MNADVVVVVIVRECGWYGHHGQDLRCLLAIVYRVLCCALCFVCCAGLRLTWISDNLILRKEHTRVYNFIRLLHDDKYATTGS